MNDRATILQAALDYAARGWHVFPCNVWIDHHGKKRVHPIPDWDEAATTDPGTIAGWWSPASNWARASVCIATGPSGLVVVDLDVDPTTGKDGYTEWERLALAPTGVVASTPSGGEHHFYLADPDRPIGISKSLVAPGIDVRGQGGFVIASPSADARGQYVWRGPGIHAPMRTVPIPLHALAARPVHQPHQAAPDLVTGADGPHAAWARAGFAGACRDFAGLTDGRASGAFAFACRLVELGNLLQVSQEITEEHYLAAVSAAIGNAPTRLDTADATRQWWNAVRHVGEGVGVVPEQVTGGEILPGFVTSMPVIEPPDMDDTLTGLDTADDRRTAVLALVRELAAAHLPMADWLLWRHGILSAGSTAADTWSTTKDELDRIYRDEHRRIEQARKAELAAAVAADRSARTEQARTQGALLPAPHEPMKVAEAIIAENAGLPGLAYWRGDWYRHAGTHWTPEAAGAVERWLAQRTKDAVYETQDGPQPWAPNTSRLRDLMRMLGNNMLGERTPDDREPCAGTVAMANGQYDLASGVLMPHSPAFFNLWSLPFAHDPDAGCPLWTAFLASSLAGQPEAVRALQQWFGYVVSGRLDLEKILYLYGESRSGKGTVATVLEALAGEANVTAPTLSSLATHFGQANLIGKNLAIMSDVKWKVRDGDEAREVIKAISGQDPRTVPRKFAADWKGKLGVRFTILSNYEPRFEDAGSALLNRFVSIHFPRSFLGQEDTTLKTRLLTELPGILNWALEGLRDLETTGRFAEPDSSAALRQQMHDGSPAGRVESFLSARCIATGATSPVDPMCPKTLFHAFAEWWDDEGLEQKHLPAEQAFVQLVKRAWKIDGDGKDQRGTACATHGGRRHRRLYGLVPAYDGALTTVRFVQVGRP